MLALSRSLLAIASALILCTGSLGGADTQPQSASPERIPLPQEEGPRQLASAPQGRPVRLKSGAFAGVGELETNLRNAAAQAGDKASVRVLVQFEQVPDLAAREGLAAAGFTLLAYIPEAAYFASVRRDADLAAFVLHGGRWLGRIEPEDKLSETLRHGQPGVWARQPDGSIRIRARIFADAVLADVVQSALASGWRRAVAMPATGQFDAEGDPDSIRQLAGLAAIQWIEEIPPPAAMFNDGLRANLQIPAVEAPPYELTGSNVVVGIWDAGWVDTDHPDFAGRLYTGESSGPTPHHFHSTHVAGTLAGDGSASASRGGQPRQWRGVAPGATLVSYDVPNGSLMDEHRDALQRFGAVLSQNSWGVTVDMFFGNCHLLGDYTGDAPNYDQLVTGLVGAPYHVVFAVGNARGRSGATGCPAPGGYRTVGVPATAKDVITVGAINSDDSSATVFSGWGPTDDGRLKPEVVAPGDEVGGDGGITSTQPGANYGVLVGTSMAAPAVSGVAALLIEDYRNHFYGRTPLPSTVKGLLIHSAQDLSDGTDWHTPGPDYASGYGRVQARAAVDQLRAGGFVIGQVAQAQTVTYWLDVPANTPSVKVTLVWDDVAAAENAARTLVNDLDLVVTDPSGQRRFPWTLDPTQPASPATRTAEDHLNVVEQVFVDAEVQPGRWQVAVVGGSLASGQPQAFTLLFTPATNVRAPWLTVAQSRFSDSVAGNGNGALDRGEEIEETVVLRNTFGPWAANVQARLATASPWVTLLSAEAAYPELLPGQAAAGLTPFRYRLSKDAPCGQTFLLEHVATVAGYQWTNFIPRVIGRIDVTNVTRQVFGAADLPQPIPDAAAMQSLLRISTPGRLRDVNVRVRLDHTWLEDLELKLRHPDGTEVVLMQALRHIGRNLGQGPCGPEVQWTTFDDSAPTPLTSGTAPFVGTFRPASALSTLINRELAGDWYLAVADTSLEDVGVLQCWELEAEYSVFGHVCQLVNRAPAASSQSVVFHLNRADVIGLDGSDPDDDPLSAQIVSAPAHGTLSEFDAATRRVRYTPDPDYLGPDSFAFALQDGYATSTPAVVSIDVRPATADLGVRLEAEPGPLRHDLPFQLFVTVTNRGPSAASGARLAARWTAPLQLLALETSQGTATPVQGGIVAEFGLLPEHGVAQIRIQAQLPSPTWVNVSASAAADVLESSPLDNTAVLAFPVLGTADLSVGAQVVPSPAPVGKPLALQLSLTNAGPHLASNVVMRCRLPDGTSVVATSPNVGDPHFADGVFSGTLGNLGVGAAVQASLTVVPSVGGLLDFPIETACDLPDPRLDNNSLTATADVRVPADLALAWAPMQQPAAIGATLTNLLVLTNRGPNTAHAVSVRVQLSPAATAIRVTTLEGSAVLSNGVITWSPGDLPSGGTATLTTAFQAAFGGWMLNLATASAPEFDPTPTDNQAEAAIEVRPGADLQAGLTLPPGPLQVGQPIVYTLTVTNAGPNPARQVVLAHELPPGTSWLDVSTSRGTVNVEPQRATIAVGDLDVAEVATIIVRVTALSRGDSVIVAQVSALEPDVLPANNRIETAFRLEEPADLGLTKRVQPAWTLFGQTATYLLTVTNRGPYAATGVQVVDSLPAELTALTTRSSQGAVSRVQGQVIFDFGTVPPGNTATGWVEAVASQLGFLTNRAVVQAEQPDLSPADNDAECALEIRPAVDLGLFDWHAVSPVVLGRESRFELVLTNRGPQTATGLKLAFALPAGADLVALSNPAGTCPSGTTSPTCEIAELPASGQVVLGLVLRPRTTTPLALSAQVTANEGDLVPGDNTAELLQTVSLDADLAVSCGTASATAIRGESVRWTLTITNSGPYDAENVELDLRWPVGAVKVRTVEPTSATWKTTPDGALIQWSRVAVSAASGVTLVLDAQAGGQFTLGAELGSAQVDLRPEDNSCATTLEVLAPADLAVRASLSPDPAGLAAALTCSIAVTNRGPADASGVVLRPVFSPGVEFMQASPGAGRWTIEPPEYRWDLDRLPANTEASVEVILKPTQTGWVTNRFTVTAREPDPQLADNALERATQVRFVSDLVLAASGPVPPLILNRLAEYRLSVANRGPDPASFVRVVNALPPGLRIENAEVSAGTLFTQPTGLNWQFDELPVNGTATMTVRLTPTTEGMLAATANVSAFETDLVTNNNAVVLPFPVQGQAELSLRQQATPPRLLGGQSVAFDLTLSNAGPQTATGIVVTNWLSPGLGLQGVELPQGIVLTNENRLELQLGNLPPSSQAQFRLRFATQAAGSLTNLAVATAEQADLRPDDNAATATVEVTPAADLQLGMVVLEPIALLDHSLHYRLSITNAGPSTATGVRVTDTLPDGLSLVAVVADTGSYAVAANEVTYDPGSLAPGQAANLTLEVRPTVPGLLTNRAVVESVDPDPFVDNNVALETTEVLPGTDLELRITPAVTAPFVGRPEQHVFTLVNHGPHVATSVALRIELSPGVALADVDPDGGSWEQGPDAVQVTLPDLPVGAETPVRLTLVPQQEGLLVISATATTGAGDLDPSNNQRDLVRTVGTGADLALEFWPDSVNAILGYESSVTLVITNHGPAGADDVAVSGIVPPGLAVTSLEGSLGTWTTSEGLLSGAISHLPAGTNAWAMATFNPTQLGELSATAQVASRTTDPDPANNTAALTGAVYEKADLLVTHEPASPQFLLGNDGTIAVTVTNRGTVTSPSTGLLVAFSLNVELRAVTLVPETALFSVSPPGVACNLGPLPPGGQARLTVRFRPSDTGRFVSQATLFSPAILASDPASSSRLERDIVTAPSLYVEHSGNRLFVSWPAVADDFVLEATESLGAMPWTPVLNEREVVNQRLVVALKPSNAQRFFRLRKAEAAR